MPEYADIYVISERRTQSSINDFLNHFLPLREESADEYEVPQYSSNPELIFQEARELISYCEENKAEVHGIYWRALEERKPEHAMVFFLSDGYVIYGLSTDAVDEVYVGLLLDELKQFFDTELGYIAHEMCPSAESYIEFKQQIESNP
jgi:hypothetical protein